MTELSEHLHIGRCGHIHVRTIFLSLSTVAMILLFLTYGYSDRGRGKIGGFQSTYMYVYMYKSTNLIFRNYEVMSCDFTDVNLQDTCPHPGQKCSMLSSWLSGLHASLSPVQLRFDPLH